jgi:hypothetical protein
MAFAAASFRVRAGGDDDFSNISIHGRGEFVSDVVRISDTLNNLTYLIELDAQHPGLVRSMQSRPINCCRRWKTWFIRPMHVCEGSCS